MKDRIKQLQRAVEKAAGCKATYIRSDAIFEGFEGQHVWDGVVETFDLGGSSAATRCYAFYFRKDDEEPIIVTVLGVPPVNSPLSAVRVAIANQTKK